MQTAWKRSVTISRIAQVHGRANAPVCRAGHARVAPRMRRWPRLAGLDGALGARVHADRDPHQGVGGEVAAGGEESKVMWSMWSTWFEGMSQLWISSWIGISNS